MSQDYNTTTKYQKQDSDPVSKLLRMFSETRQIEQPWNYSKLCILLRAIDRLDQLENPDYGKRYSLILEAVQVADRLGFQAGFRIDPDEPEWPVALIELPQGQVSWHMPQFHESWDGHDNVEKTERIKAFISQRE